MLVSKHSKPWAKTDPGTKSNKNSLPSSFSTVVYIVFPFFSHIYFLLFCVCIIKYLLYRWINRERPNVDPLKYQLTATFSHPIIHPNFLLAFSQLTIFLISHSFSVYSVSFHVLQSISIRRFTQQQKR